MKAIKTKMITMGLVSLFTMGLSQPSWSTGKGESPVQLQVISNENNSPLFQFKANNGEETEYLLKVKDANGTLLFSELLRGTNVLRKYQLDLSDADITDVLNVRFEVTNTKTKKSYVYKISRNSRVVEDVIVALL